MRHIFGKLSTDEKVDSLLVSFLVLIPIKWIIQYFYQSDWPEWFRCIFYFLMFLIIAILILVERTRLEKSNIDVLSLSVIILFGSFLRPFITEYPWFTKILTMFFAIIGVVLLYMWLIRRRLQTTIPSKLLLWIVLSFFICLTEYTIAKLITSLPPIGSSRSLFLNSLYMVNYQLSNIVIPEEAIFRGFLWGSLKRKGFADYKILLIQSFLFMTGHINIYHIRSLWYYIFILGQGVIFGLLAWRSRSILPGVITHTFHNTLAYLSSLND